jgi:hypothetical protein
MLKVACRNGSVNFAFIAVNCNISATLLTPYNLQQYLKDVLMLWMNWRERERESNIRVRRGRYKKRIIIHCLRVGQLKTKYMFMRRERHVWCLKEIRYTYDILTVNSQRKKCGWDYNTNINV